MKAWTRKGEAAVGRFETQEAQLLENLATQTKDVFRAVRDEIANFDDPVVARLFPNAYDNATDAEEFRRFTARDIAARRERAIDAIIVGVVTAERDDDAAIVTVSGDDIAAWITALADLRVILHTRINQDRASLDPDLSDADLAQFQPVIEWLAFVQATLIEVA